MLGEILSVAQLQEIYFKTFRSNLPKIGSAEVQDLTTEYIAGLKIVFIQGWEAFEVSESGVKVNPYVDDLENLAWTAGWNGCSIQY